MNFNSQICTSREQSERLLALGLKKETADMVWNDNALTAEYEDWRPLPIYADWEEWQKDDIPAWSLHRLIEIINEEIQTDWQSMGLQDIGFIKNDNLFDNFVDCIEWLIKKGYFNKGYLV